MWIQLYETSKAKDIIDDLEKRGDDLNSYSALLYIQIKNCLVEPYKLIVTLAKKRYSFDT